MAKKIVKATTKLAASIGDIAIPKYWSSKKEFAEEIGIGNVDQYLDRGAGKKLRKPGPTEKRKISGEIYFSPGYVKLVKEFEESRAEAKEKTALSATKTRPGKVRVLKSPDLTSISVPVYKNHLAILESLGMTEERIREKLKTMVEDLHKQASEKLAEVRNSIKF